MNVPYQLPVFACFYGTIKRRIKTVLLAKEFNASKEKDEEVFNTLSNDKVKIELVKYIKQNMLNMNIDEAVLKDGNLTCISMLFAFYNLCYYVKLNGKMEAFKKFVDENRSTFDYLGECHIIMPQYKEQYEYQEIMMIVTRKVTFMNMLKNWP